MRVRRIRRIRRILRIKRIICVFHTSAYHEDFVTFTGILRKPSMMRMLRITGIVFNSRITTMIAVHASHAQADH